MINRNTLKKVTHAKLKAAKILYREGDCDNAGYLLGYVVECSLKTLICKNLKILEYPDTGDHKSIFNSHSFDRLLLLSGYSTEINLAKNPGLFNNWSILTKYWTPELRYNISASPTTIRDRITALEDPTDGFFTWIKKRW